MKEAVSGRERVRLALEHKETDRIPLAMVCSGFGGKLRNEFNDYLIEKKGVSADEYLESRLDIVDISPQYIGPALREKESLWGVLREPVSYGAGVYNEILYYPLAEAETVADLDKHRWPSAGWFDYSVLPDIIRKHRRVGDRAMVVGNGNIFETSWYMRGFEQMLLDCVLNPELVHAVMNRVTDYYCEYFTGVLAAAHGEIDLVFTADDIAGQNGLLISLPMWEEFIKPCHCRLNNIIHEFGVKIIYHSDGAVMEAVPGLMEMGMDILQALQFSADGMDPQILKNRFGGKLCFEGGVSVQTTLPFGSVEDVRNEVVALIRILGENGGYILGPSHVIQAGTPPENVVAMFDAAVEYSQKR